jgi:hypothetical protein
MYFEFMTLQGQISNSIINRDLFYGEFMLTKLKMSYEKIRKIYDPTILKSLNETIRRHKKDELRELISTKEGREAIAEKVFFQLPASTKSAFSSNDSAKEQFVSDVTTRLGNVLDTPKLYKKIFGKKSG